MRRLNRGVVAPPICLANFTPGTHTWADLSPAARDEIRTCLEGFQGRRCAYCEGPLDALDAHIEHFRPRSRYQSLTFDWSNLFWSCDRIDCCGRYKDGGAGDYDPNDLIDPTADDPDRYFHFASNGTIQFRAGLADRDRHRAAETLRVFNLDANFGHLRQMRRLAVKAYFAQEPGILDALMDFPEAERRQYVEEELARTAHEPFCTVIRHLFEGLV